MGLGLGVVSPSAVCLLATRTCDVIAHHLVLRWSGGGGGGGALQHRLRKCAGGHFRVRPPVRVSRGSSPAFVPDRVSVMGRGSGAVAALPTAPSRSVVPKTMKFGGRSPRPMTWEVYHRAPGGSGRQSARAGGGGGGGHTTGGMI